MQRNGQIFWGIVVFIIIILIAIFLYPNEILVSSWLIGVLFGFVLQRTGLCFLSACSDLILTKNTSLIRAILLALFIGSIGFAFLQYDALRDKFVLIGYVFPVGFHTVFGALLFGLGIVVAGGCSSGILLRIGEGFLWQSAVVGGFMLGSFWGARDYSWWYEKFISQSPVIHLPEITGWPVAVFIQLLILTISYYWLLKYEQKGDY